MRKKITIIDLNNFSYYPTLSIGYLIAFLRKSEFDVTLLSPLNNGIGARKREKIETKVDLWKSLLLNSDNFILKRLFEIAKNIPFIYNTYLKKRNIYKNVIKDLNLETDLVLISTYFENYYICKRLGEFLNGHDIPLIIGGPGFNNKKVTNEWLNLLGVNAIVGVEIDSFFTELINDFFGGKSLDKYPGVFTSKNIDPDTSYVFNKMSELPIPDYSDFPWHKYPMKIIPYMTGRGCGWGKCNFCTDVTYVNGRSFRSLSSNKVLNDLKLLANNYTTNLVYFSDLKLNSNLEIWNTLITELPKYVNNPKWFATVHCDNRKENGLDYTTLKQAKLGGLVRLSFGLESGSQKLLDHMKKGTRIERIESFIHDVHKVGISLRATMFVGYPFEDEEDLKLTYEFLKKNSHCFDRINLSKFQLLEMAPIYKEIEREKEDLIYTKHTHHISMLKHRGKRYNKFRNLIVREVHNINRRPLLKEAIKFDGVM